MIGAIRSWRLERNDRRQVFAATDDLTVYAESNGAVTSRHAHPAWKLVLCPRSLTDYRQRGRPTLWAPGVVVPPEHVHAGGATSSYVVAYLDPWRVALPPSVGPLLLDEPTVARLLAALALDVTGDLEGDVDLTAARRALDPVLGAPPPIDPRVSHALAGLAGADRLDVLASEVGLSPPRLRWLVRDTVGIPLGRLRQWSRLRAAVAALDEGPLATAAQVGGFADQAHLTRTARRMVGRTPGTLAGTGVSVA